MPDQMISRSGEIPHFRIFPLEFLQIVFSEIAHAKAIGFLNRRGGKNLRHREQRDLLRRPAGARRRARDAGLHLLEPASEIQSRQFLLKVKIQRTSRYSPRITPIPIEPVTITRWNCSEVLSHFS